MKRILTFGRLFSNAAAKKKTKTAARNAAPAEKPIEKPIIELESGSRLFSLTLESSCKQGTVMKGLGVFADKKDPVAMADSEYPDWLWTVHLPAKKEFEKQEWFSREYLRILTKEKMKKRSQAKAISR